jgi:hypothetical protein
MLSSLFNTTIPLYGSCGHFTFTCSRLTIPTPPHNFPYSTHTLKPPTSSAHGDSPGMATNSPQMGSQSSASSPGKQIVRRRLQHVQQIPEAVEPAPQDPVYAEGQLLKSIGAALTLAGFDSVKPTALEMFRAHAEECEYMSQARTYEPC